MTLKSLLERLQLEVLTSPEMTGKWEARLREIEAGSGSRAAFTADIRLLAEQLVARTVAAPHDLVLRELPDIRMPGTDQPFVELVQDYVTVDRSVKIPKVIRGRHLLPDELHALVTQGVVGPLDGFYSKRTRKTYSACIRWIAETNRYEVFFDNDAEPPSADHPQIGVCRHCGGAVYERPTRYACVNATSASPTCAFVLKKLWCGRDVTRDEALQLLTEGRTETLQGFRDRTGRPFKAPLVINPEGRAVFDFPQGRAKRS